MAEIMAIAVLGYTAGTLANLLALLIVAIFTFIAYTHGKN